MKKILSLLLAIAMICSLSACSFSSGSKIQGLWMNTAGEGYMFAKDGTYYNLYANSKDYGKYIIDKDVIVITEGTSSSNYDFSIKDDTLILTNSWGEGEVYSKTGDALSTAVVFDTKTKSLNGVYESEAGLFAYNFSDDGTVVKLTIMGNFDCEYTIDDDGVLTIVSDSGLVDKKIMEATETGFVLYDYSEGIADHGGIYNKIVE